MGEGGCACAWCGGFWWCVAGAVEVWGVGIGGWGGGGGRVRGEREGGEGGEERGRGGAEGV